MVVVAVFVDVVVVDVVLASPRVAASPASSWAGAAAVTTSVVTMPRGPEGEELLRTHVPRRIIGAREAQHSRGSITLLSGGGVFVLVLTFDMGCLLHCDDQHIYREHFNVCT